MASLRFIVAGDINSPKKALLCNTQHRYIVDSNMYVNNRHRTHC